MLRSIANFLLILYFLRNSILFFSDVFPNIFIFANNGSFRKMNENKIMENKIQKAYLFQNFIFHAVVNKTLLQEIAFHDIMT